VSFPDRQATEQRLVGLVEGRLSPEEVADWARAYVIDESTHPPKMDQSVWLALQLLCGADMQSGPGEYLHGQRDYELWLAQYQREIENLQ
jgi:hypothetical protein